MTLQKIMSLNRLSMQIFNTRYRGMVILNPVDIFRRWCKLNFRAMWSQFKSCHFSERIGARKQQLRIFCYLLNGIGFKLDKHYNLVLYKNITNFTTNNIKISFFTHLTLPDLGKMDLIALQIASRITQESLHTFLKTSLLDLD